ncbi:hypothetical protein KUTeg_008274 [Tegillarca granosa]|uniref:Uncharacterized protein n=1 Tax=Tegillarca granosa TaxID=220873 RepID=A0ABQ9F8N4_TEGGR|nr:hypothetical protein KUTeg_008274 [Tegillarca granosa]
MAADDKQTLSPTKTKTVVGSFAEGLYLPPLVYLKEDDGTFAKKHFLKEPEVTFLHVKDVKIDFPKDVIDDECNYVISTENVRIGQCKLKVLNNGKSDEYEDIHVTRKEIKYVSSKLARQKFISKIASNRKAIESMLDTLLNKGDGIALDLKFMDVFDGIPQSDLNFNRPHTTVGLRGGIVSARKDVKQKNGEEFTDNMIQAIDADEIGHELVFHCKSWPPFASEWLERERKQNWPNPGTIDKVVSKGCDIVPAQKSKSASSEIEWKISFAVAEKDLISEEVTESQRQCFLFFKLICLHIMSEGLLTLQILKTVFFLSCEELDARSWHKDPIECVFYMFDFLLKSIKDKHLQGYFIAEDNILDHLTDVQISQLERRLTTLRRKPVEELLSVASNYTVLDVLPFYMDVKKLFNPVVSDAKKFKDRSQASVSIEIFMAITNEICNGFYHEYGFDHCASVFEDLINNIVAPVLGQEEASKQLDHIPHLLNQRNIELSNYLPPEEIWKSITFCRFLIRRFIEGNEGSGLFEYLACLYHAASGIFKNRRKEMLRAADENFKEAINREGEGHGPGLYVDYAHLLCSLSRHKEAVPHIQRVISEEKDSPSCVNYYGKMESFTVDDYIKTEIEANGSVEILSISFAYYMLVDCYRNMGKQPEVASSLDDFRSFADKIKDATTFSLLGYTLMKIGDKEKAEEAFKKAFDLNPKNKLAKANVDKFKKSKKKK